MDRISKNVVFHSTCIGRVKYGSSDSVPIDQQPSAKFNFDPASGRPISDISAIIRAQGLDKQRLLADLTEFKADFLPADVSDVDALKYAIPRLCQLPSELAEFQEELTRQQLEEDKRKRSDEEVKKLRDAFLKSDSDDFEPRS